jgi:hypothetical protein
MNRVFAVLCAVAAGAVAFVSVTECAACPQVAAAQATIAAPVASVAVAQPVVVAAPLAQAAVGAAYVQPAAFAATAAVGQPVVVAQPASFAPLQAVANVGCAGGACARATARVGMAGVRRLLLPRQRTVARAVVR